MIQYVGRDGEPEEENEVAVEMSAAGSNFPAVT